MVETLDLKVVDVFKKDFDCALFAFGTVRRFGKVEDQESRTQIVRDSCYQRTFYRDGENFEIVKGGPVAQMMDKEFTARDGGQYVGGDGLAECVFFGGHF